MEVAAASRLHLIIEKLLVIWSTPARARQSGMHAPCPWTSLVEIQRHEEQIGQRPESFF
jgi:hypothetical protein